MSSEPVTPNLNPLYAVNRIFQIIISKNITPSEFLVRYDATLQNYKSAFYDADKLIRFLKGIESGCRTLHMFETMNAFTFYKRLISRGVSFTTHEEWTKDQHFILASSLGYELVWETSRELETDIIKSFSLLIKQEGIPAEDCLFNLSFAGDTELTLLSEHAIEYQNQLVEYIEEMERFRDLAFRVSMLQITNTLTEEEFIEEHGVSWDFANLMLTLVSNLQKTVPTNDCPY